MNDLAYVYAVTRPTYFVPGHKLRVSVALTYSEALRYWGWYDTELSWSNSVLGCPLQAARLDVDYFCVRSADDPNWPNDAPRSNVRYSGVNESVGPQNDA